MSPRVRAWIKRAVSPADDYCVIWPWYLNRDGYGRVNLDGQVRSVTHLVLETAGHPRPAAPANQALHSCPGGDNPACGSVRHLRWGTHAENQQDSIKRGTHRAGPRGAQSPFTTLTDADVTVMRRRYSAGDTQTLLASEYGITQGAVSKIIRGATWAHLLNQKETA